MSGTGPTPPGMISPANPFVDGDGTLAPVSFRFLFSLLRRISALEAHAGITNGSEALPGQVGEYVTNYQLVTQWTALADAIAADLVTIPLTAGDWDVSGAAYFQAANQSQPFELRAWTNTASVTQPDGSDGGLSINTGPAGGLAVDMGVPAMRLLLTTNATVYLSVFADFKSGTMQARGYVRARRIR